MLTNEEVQYLLGLKKYLEKGKDVYILPKKTRLVLVAPENSSVKFWLELTRNEKVVLKTSIHHLETTHHIGLLRIDYKGSHKNPEIVTDKVPDIARNHTGAYINEPHAHIYVEGYKPLAWAVPLRDYDFEVKTLENSHDVNLLMAKFAEKINLKIGKIETALL